MENLGTYTDKAVELFLSYAPKMVLADPRVFKDPAPLVAFKGTDRQFRQPRCPALVLF